MSYWAAAQLDARHVRLALHCLQLSGFEIYAPRLRQRRLSRGRKIETTPLLFVSGNLDPTAGGPTFAAAVRELRVRLHR